MLTWGDVPECPCRDLSLIFVNLTSYHLATIDRRLRGFKKPPIQLPHDNDLDVLCAPQSWEIHCHIGHLHRPCVDSIALIGIRMTRLHKCVPDRQRLLP